MKLSPTGPGWTRVQMGRGRRRLHPCVWLQLFFGGRQATAWLFAVVLLVVVAFFGAVEPVLALWSRPDDLVPVVVHHVDTVGARLEINDVEVFQTTVAWTLDGQHREGAVYVTGETTWDGDTPALVSHWDPAWVEVDGFRTTKAPMGMSLIMLLLPLGAVLSAVWAWPARVRAALLLRDGMVTTAKVVRVDEVGDSDNPALKCVFHFEVGGVPVEHAITLSKAEAARVRDDDVEVVFYDRQAPQRAVLADSLPGEILVGEGEWLLGRPRAVALLVPPILFGAALALALSGALSS